MKEYLAERKVESNYLISNQRGGPLRRCFVEFLFRQYTEKLGFGVTPHTMQHTFAVHLAEKGVDFTYIQELLGHTNINSTIIYTGLMNQERKKQYD